MSGAVDKANGVPRRPRRGVGEVLRALRRPKVAVMLGLGFSSGLPFLLIGNTLSYWLGDAHVNLALIGYLSWVGLAYSLKFVWGAIVDSVPAPLLGRLGLRRGWMIWAQLAIAVGLAGMAASDPRLRLGALTGFAVLTAFAGATQDVVIDAWRIESAEDGEELDLLTASYKLGYQIAIILTTSVILLMADAFGWAAAYGAFAVLVAVGLVSTLFAREPARADVALVLKRRAGLNPMRLIDPVIGPFVAFFRQWGPMALLILLTVSAYHLSDYLRGPVINPFYVQVGLHKPVVAGVRLAVGLPFTLLGIAAGGLFAARFGHMRALLVGAVLQPFAVAAFGLLALTGPSLPVFSGLMAFDDFTMNFAGIALIAYMSTLTQLGYTATQYALLTSALAWSGKLLKGWSGAVVLGLAHGRELGGAYALFFCGAGALGVVALLLCLALAWVEGARRRQQTSATAV